MSKMTRKIYRKGKGVIENFFQTEYPLLNPISRRWSGYRENSLGVVYMLHRVSEKNSLNLSPVEDLKVSPAFLQSIINQYKSQGFDFLSVDDLYDIINSPQKGQRPFVVFTLDDGYLDNYQSAYPIFKKNNIPFALYVTTDFIERKAVLWWYIVENLILSNLELRLSDGSIYLCDTPERRLNSFRQIRSKIMAITSDEYWIDRVKDLFREYPVDWYAPIRDLAMSWEDLQVLANDELCTIGGHTVSHPVLSSLSDEELVKEIQNGLDRIRQRISKPINHFAYPFGSPAEIGKREINLINQFGLKTAFCSFGGCITSQTCNLFSLPRVMLKE